MLLNSNLNEDSSPLINQPESLHSQSITITTEFDKENMDPELKDKYDRLQKLYHLFEWVYFSCLLFFQLVFLSLFLYFSLGLSKSVIILFAFATIISLMALCNIYVKLKVMLDMLKESKNQHISLGIIVSYLCVNLGGFSCLIYLALLSTKIYVLDFLSWSIVSIPVYFTISILVLYSLFLLPVLLINKQWLDIVLVFNSLLCFLVFLVLLNSKLDNINFVLTWTMLSAPIHFSLLVYLFYLSANYFYMSERERRHQKLNLMLQLFSIILFVNGVAFLAFQLNNNGKIDFIPSAIFLVGSFSFSIEKLMGLYATEEDVSENSNPSKML